MNIVRDVFVKKSNFFWSHIWIADFSGGTKYSYWPDTSLRQRNSETLNMNKSRPNVQTLATPTYIHDGETDRRRFINMFFIQGCW
jgi:hypothetical protein